MQFHSGKGWKEVTFQGEPQVTGPHDGQKVLDTENKLKKC